MKQMDPNNSRTECEIVLLTKLGVPSNLLRRRHGRP